MKLKPSL